MKLLSITLSTFLVSVCLADTYMHNPRGSNNRLNEASANRNNGNRLFDSQNNNRGGYNVGEIGTNAFPNNAANGYATDRMTFDYEFYKWSADANNNQNRQFEEVYLEGSDLVMSWTAQHGCGNEKNNCNYVIEYTCDSHDKDKNVLNNGNAGFNQAELDLQTVGRSSATPAFDPEYNTATGMRVQLRNGVNTNTPNDPDNINQARQTFNNNNNDGVARTEGEEYYAYAKNRDRNQGLFTADQNLQGDDQTKTRQNPGGTRRGLEVPEERDYFPWWYPSPFRPVAIMSNDVTECEVQMASKSSAVEAKTACVPTNQQLNNNNAALEAIVAAETEAECNTANGQWYEQKYNMPKPACLQAQWSQVNNLGNVAGTGEGGLPATYTWPIPTVDALRDTECYVYSYDDAESGGLQEYVRIQMRFRYNMTTMDYDPYNTDANCNQDANAGVQSPVQQNPTVDVGIEMQGLKLALNTAQTGRTFQDRSHVMKVMRRPKQSAQNPATVAALALDTKIVNVNVQGKRGNIVQTYPAVEYNFFPPVVELALGDCVAMQWTGSNTHNNGNPAGDGQAGDAGEGTGGTDRHNLVQLMDKNSSFPLPLDVPLDQINLEDVAAAAAAAGAEIKAKVKQFILNANVYQTYSGQSMSTGKTGAANDNNPPTAGRDAQVYLMSGGYYNTEAQINDNNYANANNGVGGDAQLNVLLNNAPATMRSVTICPTETGEFHFACTRNNNFSNRDQKLKVIVTDPAA